MTTRTMTPVSELGDVDADELDKNLWLDLECPSGDERQRIGELLGETIPGEEDISEFEASSRFFISGNTVHLRAFCLTECDNETNITPLGVLIGKERLITVHWAPLRVVELCRERVQHAGVDISEPWIIALELFETHIDLVADRIETLYERVDRRSALLSEQDAVLGDAIMNLSRAESLNEKLHFCLLDQQQTLANLNRHNILEGRNKERLSALLADIRSLIDHSEGILQRISLHASMVMSRTQLADSRVTKVFSVIATLFLPPTMIASIYGMNFERMPELSWPYGYAMAIGLMVLSSAVPFLYFKHRRWL